MPGRASAFETRCRIIDSILRNDKPVTQPPNRQVRLEIPANLSATYANAVIVSQTTSEIVLDFLQVMPNDPRARVQQRVVMTPSNAKLFLQALQAGNGPEAFVYQPQQRVDWNQQIMVAVQRVDEGYVIEAAIPWSLLGRQPAPGAAFGLAFGAFDNDLPGSAAQQTAVAHPPGLAFDRPTTYSNLRLQ